MSSFHETIHADFVVNNGNCNSYGLFEKYKEAGVSRVLKEFVYTFQSSPSSLYS